MLEGAPRQPPGRKPGQPQHRRWRCRRCHWKVVSLARSPFCSACIELERRDARREALEAPPFIPLELRQQLLECAISLWDREFAAIPIEDLAPTETES